MKRIKTLSVIVSILLLFALCIMADAAALFNYPKFRATTSTGSALSGGKLYTYVPGTSTLKATYADRAKVTANANPVVLDSNGEATIYLDGNYKMVLKSSAGVTQWTMDSVSGITPTAQVYEVDALDYGSGDYTQATITTALTAIGMTNKATLLLRSGTWVISSNADWSAYTNVTFKIVPGAMISHGAYTISFGGPVSITSAWPFSGTGALTFTPVSATSMFNKALSLKSLEPAETANMNGGTLTESGLSFVGQDSAGAYKRFGSIMGYQELKTAGAEKGQIWFFTNDDGTIVPQAHIEHNGRFCVVPNGGTPWTGKYGRTYFAAGDGADEVLAELSNISTPAINNLIRLYFTALPTGGTTSADALKFGGIYSRVTDVTPAAQSGSMAFEVVTGGRETEMVLSERRELYGYNSLVVASTTSPVTVDATGSNTVYTNEGATGTIQFNLPQITTTGIYKNLGMKFTFTAVTGGQRIDLHPYAITDHIYPIQTSDSKDLRSNSAAGDSVTIMAVAGSRWQIISHEGTWTEGP